MPLNISLEIEAIVPLRTQPERLKLAFFSNSRNAGCAATVFARSRINTLPDHSVDIQPVPCTEAIRSFRGFAAGIEIERNDFVEGWRHTARRLRATIARETSVPAPSRGSVTICCKIPVALTIVKADRDARRQTHGDQATRQTVLSTSVKAVNCHFLPINVP